MISIAHNAIAARIVDADRDALLEVHRLLSYSVAGAEHSEAVKSGSWNGVSSFFNYDRQTFPTGFVRLVAQGLRKIGREVQIVAKPAPAPLGPENPVVDEFGPSERYDYQPEAVRRLEKYRNVTIQVATGGGKSRIARMAMVRIGRQTLFLTTRGILMHQMRKAIEKMTGEPCAVLGDGDWGIPYRKADGSEGRRLTKFAVGMVQTLSQRLEKMTVKGELDALHARRAVSLQKEVDALQKKLLKAKTPPLKVNEAVQALKTATVDARPSAAVDKAAAERKVAAHERKREAAIAVLERFEFVIAEEAHEVSGTGFFDVMNACKNAHYRMALTATPFMKDDESANMRLLATCGPIALQISEALLIERGILARPYFKFHKIPEDRRPKKLYRSTSWQAAYEVGIVNFDYRNKLIAVECLRGMRYGLTSMVLVQHKAHGEVLRQLLAGAGARVEFIYGENDQDERDRCLAALGSGRLDVLIGSTILDVGVDVPAVGIIVLAGGGKAEVALRQRVGRGLREKKRGPNVAFIIDFDDGLNTHLVGHARQRRAIIEGTPGFVEGIVSNDFDFEVLGFRKASEQK